MSYIEDFFDQRISLKMSDDKIFCFVDDIIENINLIHANPYDLQVEGLESLLANYTDKVMRCIEMPISMSTQVLSNPLMRDLPEDGFQDNRFSI